jgi:YVTN family beta-propeller protein
MSFGKRAARVGLLPAAAALAAGSLLLIGGGAAGAARTPAAAAGMAARATEPASIGLTGNAQEVAVDPTADVAYVTVWSETSSPGHVAVIYLATGAVTATIKVGAYPREIAVDPATDTVYVIDIGSDAVDVIDGATNTVTASIPRNPARCTASRWTPRPAWCTSRTTAR